jgi:hypothetical protein
MRLALATAIVLASSTAFASSITTIAGAHGAGPSIVQKRCAVCEPLKPRAEASSYRVPDLEYGAQKTDIVEIDGEKKIVRTEAWLGGSPVIHVSKLPIWMVNEKAIAALHPRANGSTEIELATTAATGDGVDIESTTGALKTSTDATRITEAAVSPTPLSIDSFRLRTSSFN